MRSSTAVAGAPVMDGVKRGVDRFEFHVPEYRGRDASLAQASALTQEAIDDMDHEISARGAEIIAELTAIAVCARDHYGEEPLTVNFTTDFIGWAERFLNSWMHE